MAHGRAAGINLEKENEIRREHAKKVPAAGQFPNQFARKKEFKCERSVKVFNSSVEKRVEKRAAEMKSLIQRAACADCTILVQLHLENSPASRSPRFRGKIRSFCRPKERISIPMRGRFQFDGDRVGVLADVVPLSVRM